MKFRVAKQTVEATVTLNYEEMVQLCAALRRLRQHTLEEGRRMGYPPSHDEDYGQCGSVTDRSFLKELHKTLREHMNI